MKIGAGILPAFVLFGVAGWTLENVKRGPTFSKAFCGRRIPFLPVYAIGGTAILLLTPAIAKYPAVARFGIYFAATSAIEAVAGIVDRADGDRPSWDYNGSPVNLGYSLLWASAAMVLERVAVVLAAKR